MKLIFIHGYTSSGKFTVGKELEKLTKYKLFHNHLTFDLLNPIFPWGTKEFHKLNRKIRLEIFEEAAKSDINGMIFTMGYRPKENDDFVKKVISIFEENNGKVFFVFLNCDEKELIRRAGSDDRKIKNKISDTDKLKEMNKKWGKVDFAECLEINNTNLSPNETANKIISHFGL